MIEELDGWEVRARLTLSFTQTVLFFHLLSMEICDGMCRYRVRLRLRLLLLRLRFFVESLVACRASTAEDAAKDDGQ